MRDDTGAGDEEDDDVSQDVDAEDAIGFRDEDVEGLGDDRGVGAGADVDERK